VWRLGCLRGVGWLSGGECGGGGLSAARVDVTAALSREGAAGIPLHRSRFLDARDCTRHHGIPITTIPRTLLDLAATVAAHRLEPITTPSGRATTSRPGSWASCATRACQNPTSTIPSLPPTTDAWQPDFCWPTHRLIVETDGWETHRTRAAFEQDRRRDAALTAD
jgi:hypothetical protein